MIILTGLCLLTGERRELARYENRDDLPLSFDFEFYVDLKLTTLTDCADCGGEIDLDDGTHLLTNEGAICLGCE